MTAFARDSQGEGHAYAWQVLGTSHGCTLQPLVIQVSHGLPNCMLGCCNQRSTTPGLLCGTSCLTYSGCMHMSAMSAAAKPLLTSMAHPQLADLSQTLSLAPTRSCKCSICKLWACYTGLFSSLQSDICWCPCAAFQPGRRSAEQWQQSAGQQPSHCHSCGRLLADPVECSALLGQ